MRMNVLNTKLDKVKLIEPQVFGDARGFFMESWNQRDFNLQVKPENFVQDNHSRSKKGVVRGLHFQLSPYPQAKLVRCIYGSIYDVAVDIRKSSSTFGGFVALTDFAEVCYKTNEFWHKECEGSIRWDDPDIGVVWPLDVTPCLSEKDALAPYFKDAKVFD